MHEFSLIVSILDIVKDVAKEQKVARITKVSLTIGNMRQIVPETMKFAFQAASKDTVAEGAELAMEFLPTNMHCNNCGNEFEPEENVYICLECGSSNLECKQGMELLVQSIEGDA